MSMADAPLLELPAVRDRLHSLTSSASAARFGRQLVNEGIYQFRGFKPVKLDLFSDWTANPHGHRSWQWQTASFNFIPWLIAYHASSGDARALNHAFDAVSSWEDTFFQDDRGYEFAWHDHATSSRALNVLWLLAYLQQNELERARWPRLESFLRVLGERLAGEDIYTRNTNHGIDQCRVLAMLGAGLPTLPEAGEWLALAMRRLGEELDFAFRPDGSHVENSPAYHQFVSSLFTEVARTFTPEQLGPLRGRLEEKLPRAAEFLAWVVRPDGQLPPIGDTELRPAVNVYRTLHGSPSHAGLDWVIWRGTRGRVPRGWARTFGDGGYFIAREDFDGGRIPGDAFHLVLRCGAHSRYHRHDDDLSLVLHWGGDWLLDGGMYNYVERAPVRRYLRSKWAHNVPVPEGFGPDWSRPSPLAEGGLACLRSGDDVAEVEAWTASYPGHRASRKLTVDRRQRSFDVEDTLVSDADTDGGSLLSLWHVPAQREVIIEGRVVRILDPGSGRELRIEAVDAHCEGAVKLEPAIEGAGTGAVWSAEVNQLQPATVVAFRYRGPAMHSKLRFSMIDPMPDVGAAPCGHGRRLYAAYCAEPAAWWPENGQRQVRKITERLSQLSRRDGCVPAQLVDDYYSAAALRQRSRRPTVYLANIGSSGSHWLESLLVAGGGMLGAGEVYLPPAIRDRLAALAERDRACFIDALHLLHARAHPTRCLEANAINSTHTLRPEPFLATEPGALRILLLRDPVEICLSRTFRKDEYRNDVAPGVDDETYADTNIKRVKAFLAWAKRQSFARVVHYEALLDNPFPEVREICRLAGAPLDEAALEKAIERHAAANIAGKGGMAGSNLFTGERRPVPPALVEKVRAELGELAAGFGYPRA